MAAKSKSLKASSGAKEGRGGKPAACGGRISKAAKYAQLRGLHPEWTDAACREAAGYSPKSHSAIKAAKPFIQDMRQRIEAAQRAAGITAEDNLRVLKRIRDKGEDKDAISSVKVITEITGERMPTEVNVNIRTDEQILAGLLGQVDDD